MTEENQHAAGEEIVGDAVPQEAVEVNQESEQERNVPLSALESERSKRQGLEDENRMMKEHYALMQAQQATPQAPPKDEYDGLDDSDVMTVGEFKKLSNKMASNFQMTLEELKMTQNNPDYQEVITKYLPEVFKTNPGLKAKLQKSQDFELAYYLAKNSDSYRSENKRTKRNEDADRILKNTQAAGSLSSVGSSTPVRQAKSYKNMSDSDFRNLTAKNLGY